MTVKFVLKNQPEFNAALRSYMRHTRRDLADVLNKKAYFVARRAIWHTHKASRPGIMHELEASEIRILKMKGSGYATFATGKKAGRIRSAKGFKFGSKFNPNTSRIAKILIAGLRKRSKPIPDAEEIQRLSERMLKARLRSIAFIKSGWITARDGFKKLIKGFGVGLPPNDKDAKQAGMKKGGFRPAKPGTSPRAILWNAAHAKRDQKNAIGVYGAPALQRAFDEEIRSMRDFVLNKELKASARRQGIKVR